MCNDVELRTQRLYSPQWLKRKTPVNRPCRTEAKIAWEVCEESKLLQNTGWRFWHDWNLVDDAAQSMMPLISPKLDRPQRRWTIGSTASCLTSLGQIQMRQTFAWKITDKLGSCHARQTRPLMEAYDICSYIIDSATLCYVLHCLLRILTTAFLFEKTSTTSNGSPVRKD